MAKTITVEIITAERVVYREDVNMVVAPGIEGQLGILPRHAALLTALQPGELRVKKDGQEVSMSVTGGFIEVRPDKVTVLADAAERSEEIDVARAEAAMKRAQERLKTKDAEQDLEVAIAALRRASVRLKIARKRSGAPPRATP